MNDKHYRVVALGKPTDEERSQWYLQLYVEQQRRFERRSDDPLRQWKLSEIDVQAQDSWEAFTDRKYEMLQRTHTSQTPIIRSRDKHLASLDAMRVILDAVDHEERDAKLDFVPDPAIVVSGAQEVELMEADRIQRGRFRHRATRRCA